jgi:hypothetical protein
VERIYNEETRAGWHKRKQKQELECGVEENACCKVTLTLIKNVGCVYKRIRERKVARRERTGSRNFWRGQQAERTWRTERSKIRACTKGIRSSSPNTYAEPRKQKRRDIHLKLFFKRRRGESLRGGFVFSCDVRMGIYMRRWIYIASRYKYVPTKVHTSGWKIKKGIV